MRNKVLATVPVAAQFLGGAGIGVGLYLVAGLGVALIVTGVFAVVAGTANEAGWI